MWFFLWFSVFCFNATGQTIRSLSPTFSRFFRLNTFKNYAKELQAHHFVLPYWEILDLWTIGLWPHPPPLFTLGWPVGVFFFTFDHQSLMICRQLCLHLWFFWFLIKKGHHKRDKSNSVAEIVSKMVLLQGVTTVKIKMGNRRRSSYWLPPHGMTFESVSLKNEWPSCFQLQDLPPQTLFCCLIWF